jgi:FkbH-like protein
LRESTSDLPTYLKSLEMKMRAEPFDALGQARITQLINKTNQFNLTTRRYSDQEVAAVMTDPDAITLQVRLTDRYGDNGMIAVVIAKPADSPNELMIDTWLMSCRVLGRQVEQATLNLLAAEACRRGYKALIGEFRPTAKNALVRDHYAALGFLARGAGDGKCDFWRLSLDEFVPFNTFVGIEEMQA